MFQQLTKKGYEGLLAVYIVISLTLSVLKIWLKMINKALFYPHVTTHIISATCKNRDSFLLYTCLTLYYSRLIRRPVRSGLVRRWATKQVKLV